MTEGRWLGGAFGLTFTQNQVDFVVPRLDRDLRLCIDPFLLFKSRRADLREAHATLVGIFNSAFEAFRTGDPESASRLMDFPEAPEIRFGYSASGSNGSGMGPQLSSLLLGTMEASPLLIQRGVRHVEELQLFIYGIGPDRISDLAANVLRGFLITYTQEQAGLWDIPLASGVPIEHVWDRADGAWADGYYDLPLDPATGLPILLVPRWIVRRLPFIEYEDYLRSDLRRFLRASLPGSKARAPKVTKHQAAEISQRNLQIVDDYVDRKEREAADAQPALGSESTGGDCGHLVEPVTSLPHGKPQAYEYQRRVLALLNCLFEPELVNGQPQSRTASGVEIRDLIFENNSDMTFFRYLLNQYGSFLVPFELKNVKVLTQDDVNQLAGYLGDPLGRCGFLLARNPPKPGIVAKVRAVYNKDAARKVIVILHDADLVEMARLQSIGQHPVSHLRKRYRELIQSME